MGKAHQAPDSTHRRKYWVTDHARDRLRGRIHHQEGMGVEYRDVDDLNNWIDSLVVEAIRAGCWEDIIDDGVPAQLVDIRHPSNNEDLWAIIKENTSSKTNKAFPRAVVTLLYTKMVQASKASGKWLFAFYDDKPDTGGLSAQDIKNLQQPTAPVAGVPMAEKKRSILIIYYNKPSVRRYQEWSEVEAAEQHLSELRNDPRVDSNTIRVFIEVQTKECIVL